MLVALAVTFIGLAMGVSGMLQPDMYDIGVMVTFIGLIGVVVRLADWLRALRR